MRAWLGLGLAAALAVGTSPACGSEGSPAAAPGAASTKESRAAALEKGLALFRSKAVDGKWGPPGKSDPGVTALVLTAFLERPGGPAESDRPLVDAGIAWLLTLQKEDGGIYDKGSANYTTSLAVQALSLHGKEKHAAALAKAAAFLRKMQFHEEGLEGGNPAESRRVGKDDLRYGGIGYGSDHTQPDLSNSQFALESLRAAGVPESDPAFQKALVYLRRTQNRKENETAGEPMQRADKDKVFVRAADGGATYRPFDSKAGEFARPDGKLESRSYGSMTYALLKCYLFAGMKSDDPAFQDAAKWIRANYTWEENPGFPDPKLAGQGLYYYYATAARTLELLGDGAAGSGADGKPRDWRGDLGAKLIATQAADGSWMNANDRWMEGLPEICTAFAVKALASATR